MSADMCSLSHELHSSRLELVGLVPALSGLCEEITKKYKIDVHFSALGVPANQTKDIDLCLFRIAQASLSNVAKHSGANIAQVELRFKRHAVSLRISDAGKGFYPEAKQPGEGIGLISMRERLRLLNGRLSIRSEPLRGTEILAEIPLSTAVNDEPSRTYSELGVES